MYIQYEHRHIAAITSLRALDFFSEVPGYGTYILTCQIVLLFPDQIPQSQFIIAYICKYSSASAHMHNMGLTGEGIVIPVLGKYVCTVDTLLYVCTCTLFLLRQYFYLRV